jgi:hypothetical protein
MGPGEFAALVLAVVFATLVASALFFVVFPGSVPVPTW